MPRRILQDTRGITYTEGAYVTTAPLAPVAYDTAGAAAAAGVSVDVIKRALRAGDIEARYPKVDGRTIAKPLIPADELRRWVEAGSTERPT